MSDKLCACCGNRVGCDCPTVQSAQFRRIAELEAVLREVAKSPWAYSDPASLLATLGRRAERVLYAPLDAAGERKPSEKTT